MASDWRNSLKKIDDYRWELAPDYKPGMRVPGRIYTSERMLEQIGDEQAPEQVANVAFLPGIVGKSLAMPDIHWGYGFPIGGVAATRVSDGVISPGGVGFDINCGVRLLRTNLTETDVKPRIEQLVARLFTSIPSGLGSEGRIRLKGNQIDRVLIKGARWAIEEGYGEKEDLELTENGGCLAGADPEQVSEKAKKRGTPQLGTLGSGNHFLEIQVVDEIYDSVTANAFGVEAKGQVLILIHTGSRGFGHQVCDDYLKTMGKAINSLVTGRNMNTAAIIRTTAKVIWRADTLTHWATNPPAKDDASDGSAIAPSSFQSTVLLRPNTSVAEMLASMIMNRLVVDASCIPMPTASRIGT